MLTEEQGGKHVHILMCSGDFVMPFPVDFQFVKAVI